MAEAKGYTRQERQQVKQKKTAEYGRDEVFAVPRLRSYPLTKDRRPDAERVKAAWDYIHVAKNRAKLGEDAAKATARIRAFAHKHFPDMQLEEDTRKSWATEEIYVFPAERIWPLTESRRPSAEAVQKAWQSLHSAQVEYRMPDQAMAVAEQRIALFAARHHLPLQARQRLRQGMM